MFILGIIGTPAGGKSTVAARLQELGAAWINADLVARDVLHRPDVTAEVIEYFGKQIATSIGAIDRKRLAGLVFGDDDRSRTRLKYLESVLHPKTRLEITNQLVHLNRDGVSVTVLDVPLLLETHWDFCCDSIWCVDAPVAERQDRARRRGWPDGELKRREDQQLSIAEKIARSNLLIQNDLTTDHLIERVDRLFAKIRERQTTNGSGQSDITHCLASAGDSTND